MTFKRVLEQVRFQQYRLKRRFFLDMADRFLPSRRALAATARRQRPYRERSGRNGVVKRQKRNLWPQNRRS